MFKKNQIVITALALMIAIAGYLNYSGTKLNEAEVQANTTEVEAEGAQSAQDTEGEEYIASDISEEDIFAQLDNEPEPGEAVLANTSAGVGFAAEAKVTREQMRSQNKAALMELINNTNIEESQKQAAIDSMIAMTDISEREAAAEILLQAKGFEDAVVSITDNAVDVVINMSEVSDAGRAQIEDIIKRKTGVAPENIVITPIAVVEE